MSIMKSAVFAFFLSFLCLAASAEDAASLISKGDAFDKQLKTSDALAAYLEAEKQTPKDADLLCKIAKQYGLSMDDVTGADAMRERAQKSLEYAKKAAAVDANNALAQLSLAIAYGRLAPLLDNKTKIAYSKLVKEHGERALQLDPNNYLTSHVLGAWNYELANLNPVLRVIASAIYGTLPSASNEQAVEYFKKSIALNPNGVASHVELGRTYLAMSQKSQAATELKKAISLPSKEKDDEYCKRQAREVLAKL